MGGYFFCPNLIFLIQVTSNFRTHLFRNRLEFFSSSSSLFVFVFVCLVTLQVVNFKIRMNWNKNSFSWRSSWTDCGSRTVDVKWFKLPAKFHNNRNFSKTLEWHYKMFRLLVGWMGDHYIAITIESLKLWFFSF